MILITVYFFFSLPQCEFGDHGNQGVSALKINHAQGGLDIHPIFQHKSVPHLILCFCKQHTSPIFRLWQCWGMGESNLKTQIWETKKRDQSGEGNPTPNPRSAKTPNPTKRQHVILLRHSISIEIIIQLISSIHEEDRLAVDAFAELEYFGFGYGFHREGKRESTMVYVNPISRYDFVACTGLYWELSQNFGELHITEVYRKCL